MAIDLSICSSQGSLNFKIKDRNPRIRLGPRGPWMYPITLCNISFQKSIIWFVQCHVSQEQKKGRKTWDLTKEALHQLQETINCMFQDKGTTAIQLVPNVQRSRGHKFIFTSTGEVHVSVDYLLFNKRNSLYSLYRKKAFTRLRKREKMIDHRARLRENDDLPHARAKP